MFVVTSILPFSAVSFSVLFHCLSISSVSHITYKKCYQCLYIVFSNCVPCRLSLTEVFPQCAESLISVITMESTAEMHPCMCEQCECAAIRKTVRKK